MDSWQKLATELDSLKLTLQLTDTQKMLAKDFEFIKNYKTGARTFEAISDFARRAAEQYYELSKQGQVVKQLTHKDPISMESVESAPTLGNLTTVRFPALNVEMKAKVDTGATTSSLDAIDIHFDKGRGSVSFKSEALSQNVITLPVEGAQEVHSADGGGQQRPIVKLDIEIGGTMLKGMMFNLNDRSNMDSKLLIGQNILKAGNFSVNVNKEPEQPDVREAVQEKPVRNLSEHAELAQAIELLRNQNVNFEEIFRHLSTEALLKVEHLEK